MTKHKDTSSAVPTPAPGPVWHALTVGATLAELKAGVILSGMTLVFVSLCLVEFFKAFSFRSDRETLFRRPFANKWLNLAIIWELSLLMGIVYLPLMHKPLGTFSLPLSVWPVLLGVAVTIVPVLEAGKWAIRRRWIRAAD